MSIQIDLFSEPEPMGIRKWKRRGSMTILRHPYHPAMADQTIEVIGEEAEFINDVFTGNTRPDGRNTKCAAADVVGRSYTVTDWMTGQTKTVTGIDFVLFLAAFDADERTKILASEAAYAARLEAKRLADIAAAEAAAAAAAAEADRLARIAAMNADPQVIAARATRQDAQTAYDNATSALGVAETALQEAAPEDVATATDAVNSAIAAQTAAQTALQAAQEAVQSAENVFWN
jgi:hypothetical protein